MEDNYEDFINSTRAHDVYVYYETDNNDIVTYPHSDYFFEIRLSIFFIAALCVGVPCLIWAFYFVHLQRKTRSRISAFIILLLLCDLLQLLLYIYIVSKLLTFFFFHGFDSEIIVLGYFCLKVCGVHLQQLVALEGVLTLKYPLISAHIFSTPCYIIISIIILIFPVMCALLLVFGGPGSHGFNLGVGSILAPVCLFVVTGIFTCKSPPTAARTSVSDNRPGASLFLVTMVTLFVLYLPCVLVHILVFHMPSSWFMMTHCLLSLTVISEPLQCVLVCRALSNQTKQTHIELNTEQTSV